MEAISKILSNPEWWFGTIFVGIVFMVAGAYARDWLDAGLSALSRRYRARSARLLEEKRQRIALLLMEPTLLVVAHQRLTHLLIIYAILLALSYGQPAYSALIAHFPDADPFSGVLPRAKLPYANVITTFIAIVGAMVAQWKALDASAECRMARKRVEEVTAQRVAAHAATLAASQERS